MRALPYTRLIDGLVTGDGPVSYQPAFVPRGEADELFHSLQAEVQFDRPQDSSVFVHGRWHEVPRLQAAYGDDGLSYRFARRTVQARPWRAAPTLLRLRDRLCEESGFDANFVLLNLYRDGSDSIGWHSDDEANLGPAPTILSLSLSLGVTRDFQLRRRDSASNGTPTITIPLEHGSLLTLRDPTIKHWRHQVPRRGGAHPERIGPRLNLTWRRIV